MDELLSLIGKIYDAALAPALWTDVLADIGAYADAAHVTLILEDAARPQNSVFYTSYADIDWALRYINSYMLINPMRLAMITTAATGEIILTSDFMAVEDYPNTRFCRELFLPKRVIDVAAAVLEKTASTITVLSLKRSIEQGFADEALRQKIARIAPHLRRAVAIGRALERKTLEAASLSQTLDRLAGAVFLLDGNGMTVHANAAGQTMLTKATMLRNVGGLLSPVAAAARAPFGEAMEKARRGDAAIEQAGIAITLPSPADGPHVGVAMPLTSAARRAVGSPYHAVVALCVKPAEFDAPPQAPAVLAELYDLTRREVAVLVTIVENGGVPQTADVLGLSTSTVKSFLKSIFAKTGARRQADLVKLLAGATTPLR